ncbi:hypothetical protein BQ8794_30031 [Mesorhizobium prunaredense]|uniref:Uncharacterized protein n=1 Tax=Mesorhizobium prunaredense TaxID=1631249 RepID=A0A1R3VCS3_9HYPH|nr:hypothetical protein BQ8794_30031 [Mesorhizobium prunaredense]
MTAKRQKRGRIKDIARVDTTTITLSRVINFAQFGRLLVRDRACRKWMDRKMVALPTGFWMTARSSGDDPFRSGLSRCYKYMKSLRKRNQRVQFRFILRVLLLGHRQPRSTPS